MEDKNLEFRESEFMGRQEYLVLRILPLQEKIGIVFTRRERKGYLFEAVCGVIFKSQELIEIAEFMKSIDTISSIATFIKSKRG